MKKLILIVMMVSMGAAAISATDVGTRGRDHDSILSEIPMEALSGAEREALLYMAEEEKLARDVYTYLYKVWNLRTFENIAGSEQQHMDSVISVVERYGIGLPGTLDTPGVFENAELQKMYDDLTVAGRESPVAALTVGATIEDVDIADLHRELQLVDNQDITMVFESLIAGSENHMRAFVRQLDREGATYTPQYIGDEQFRDIISGTVGGGPRRGDNGGSRWARRS